MKSFIMKLSIMILPILTSSCIWNVDRPNPFEYERWKMPKHGDLVEIAMLECGFPDLKATQSEGFGYADVVMAGKCMRANGYKQSDSGGDRLCRYYPDLAPCKRGSSLMFVRSRERRLNSPYCKKYTKSNFCE